MKTAIDAGGTGHDAGGHAGTGPGDSTDSLPPAGLTAPQRIFDQVMRLGPVALLVAGCIMGALGVHASGDVWIGLAVGREIVETGHVPVTDPFSYTFNGQPFFDQNWLSHLISYWLYTGVGPAGVPLFTWAIDLLVYGLLLWATRMRSGSWLAAIVATGLIAAVSRHYLDARPGTLGYTCLMIMCVVLHYYSIPREKSRWWPALLLLPVLLVWGNVHGSFILGYPLLAAFIGCWLVGRCAQLGPGGLLHMAGESWRDFAFGVVGLIGASLPMLPVVVAMARDHKRIVPALALFLLAGVGVLWLVAKHGSRMTPARRNWLHLPVSSQHVLVFGAVALVSAAITVLVGPYGMDNFIHPTVVGGSPVFRTIAEWHPPWVVTGRGLDVWPFFVALGVAVFSLLVVLVLRAATKGEDRRHRPATKPGGSASGPSLPATRTFDLILFSLGIYIAFFARRFAPVCYIMATPVFVMWLVRLSAPLTATVRRTAYRAVCTASWIVALVVGTEAVSYGHYQLVSRYASRPQFDLLERFTDFDQNPVDAFEFLRQIKQPFNVLAEWTVAGPLLFAVPEARVFVDGRSQQVYSEAHYLLYTSFFDPGRFDPNTAMGALLHYGTDAILLRRGGGSLLIPTVERDRRWLAVLFGSDSALYVRSNSAMMTEIERLERAGQLVWPSIPLSQVTRGNLWLTMEPSQPERGLAILRAAVDRDQTLGIISYRPMLSAWQRLGRTAEAVEYFQTQLRRMQDPRSRLSSDQRQKLQQFASQCLAQAQASLPPPTAPPPSP